MERLIDAVRRYPCLWNTTAIEYRDLELKEAAWAEVMKNTTLNSVKEVKLKWKKLRDSYRDALRRQSEAREGGGGAAGAAGGGPGGGGGAKRVAVWKYMNHMSFLQPFMNNRKNMKIAESSPGPQATPTENGQSQNGGDATTDDSSSDDEPSLKRRGDQLSHIDRDYHCKSQCRRSCSETERRALPPPPPPPDALDIFFNSMCQSTKRLPYPTQIKIKKVLFNAVVGAEEAVLAEQANYASLWAAGDHSSTTSSEEESAPAAAAAAAGAPS